MPDICPIAGVTPPLGIVLLGSLVQGAGEHGAKATLQDVLDATAG